MPEVPQDVPLDRVPFFATEDAFLQAVYDNWRYFVRVLVNQFPSLVERRRATGSAAPLHGGWRSHLDTDTSSRHYEVCFGSCDAEDIIMDALERCMHNPALASFYRQYTPLKSAFKTWFVNHLRSCAGVRIRQWACRKPHEVRLDKARCVDQGKRKRRSDVATFISPKRPALVKEESRGTVNDIAAAAEQSRVPKILGETVEAFVARGGCVRCMPAGTARNFPPDLASARDEEIHQRLRHTHARTTRAERQEPWYHPDYSTIEARLDLQTLAAAYLTDEEQHILAVRLGFAYADVAFAQEIGFSYDQARSKVSYIIKKIKKYMQ
jgi:hypothetical protein